MGVLSRRSTNLLLFSDCLEFVNFSKSITNSLKIWGFIDWLRIRLKCHPMDEMQEIIYIDSVTFIDFSSRIFPFIVQDRGGLAFLEIELSSMFNKISSLLIILKKSDAKMALLIFKEGKSILIGRCEYLFKAHVQVLFQNFVGCWTIYFHLVISFEFVQNICCAERNSTLE